MGMSNQDAEWLASRRFSIEDSPACSTYRLFFCRNTATAPTQFQRGKPRVSDHDNAPMAGDFEQQIKAALLVASPVPGTRIWLSLIQPIYYAPHPPNVMPV